MASDEFFIEEPEEFDYPAHIMSSLELIETLKLNGEHEKSVKEAQSLLCEDPDCVPALEELADNYVSLNKYDEAEKAANRALSLNKGSYTGFYILGFLASNNQNWKRAIDMLQKANKLYANNPEILRCLGWASFNDNKRTQGLVLLERSLNLNPENSLTLCDLGICYLQVKKFEKAMELLKKAMDIDPDNKRIKECYRAAKGFSEKYSALTRMPKKREAERKMF